MKKTKSARQTKPLTPEAQGRLIAYTTAAGLGAFFAGQCAEGQVTQSPGLGPYPNTMVGESITNAFSVMGDGVMDFRFAWTGQGWSEGDKGNGGYQVPTYSYNGKFCTLLYATTAPAPVTYSVNWWNVGNFVVNPYGSWTTHNGRQVYQAYPLGWSVGQVVDKTAFEAGYIAYGWQIANGQHNNFPTNGALAFTFVRTNLVSTNRFYGYMDLQISPKGPWPGYWSGYTATVTNMFYNATPGASITIGATAPTAVKVSNISYDANQNTVTVNFTSTDGNLASAFTLQTSTSLGASANWTTDDSAVITSSAPGVYQAVTTGSGGIQYYRVIDQ